MKFSTQKFHRERFFWITFSVILVVLAFVLFLKNISYKSKLISTQQHEKMLTTEIEDLKNSLDESEKLLKSQSLLRNWDLKRLKEKGLRDPIKDIITDLIKHKELIPYKGVLGGVMHFYESGIYVLTPKWVYAYFEDGHIAGRMLLEYQVSDEGKISWRVVDSYLCKDVQ